jgi:asparagine synthase (glutamine-hydrolysing)
MCGIVSALWAKKVLSLAALANMRDRLSHREPDPAGEWLDDQRVVEFAWHLPIEMNFKNGINKWILREVLYRHVPREVIDRPTMRFGVPIDQWLHHELRPWAETLLDEKLLAQQEYLNVGLVCKVWLEHLSGRRNWQYQLWVVWMFQAWFAVQL